MQIEPAAARSGIARLRDYTAGLAGAHTSRREESVMADLVSGSNAHVFGLARPQAGRAASLHQAPPRNTAFRDLPPPTGSAPFRLDLKDVVAPAVHEAIVRKRKLVFHLNGDMGGIEYAVPQELVAKGMENDFQADASEPPAFLYVTGDCVYFNGQVGEYYKQFYQPYEFYLAPVFAVPGNHDGDNLPDDQTLDGFVRNFCAPQPVKMPESGDSHRTAMVQPNVYWTLLTPQASIIGLYSNVPAGGEVRTPQKEWLASELATLPRDLPLLLALHHPIYSADDHHSGSTYMKDLVAEASAAAGRHPDAILAGHVHNYQRLTRDNGDGGKTLFLVTGAGGYHNLHQIMKVNGRRLIPPAVFHDSGGDAVTLENYSDDHHGFLRVELSDGVMQGQYYEVPRPQEPFSKGSHLLDHFRFDFRQKAYLPNTPS